MTEVAQGESVPGFKLWGPQEPGRDEVLGLLVGAESQPVGQASRNVSLLAGAVKSQGLRLDLLLSATRTGRYIAAAAALESPGGSALVLLGRSDEQSLDATVAAALLRELMTRAWDRDITLLQALLLPGDRKTAGIYRRAGFTYLAELVYRDCDLAGPISTIPKVRDLTYVTFSPRLEDQFIQTMDASYVGSLDCPGLTGARDTRNVLLGHKHTGLHDPNLWFLARRGEQPVGVLLLAAVPEQPRLEVVYMGVVASERGGGIGGALLSFALKVARRRRMKYLTLAVDSTNTYACRLYDRWGFLEVARRRAWIARRPM